MRHGTWQETGGGGDIGGGWLVAAVVAAVLLGTGAAAAVASAIVTIVIVVGAVLALSVVALAVVLVYRLRRYEPQGEAVLAERAALVRAEQERPAIEQGSPRELHQHWHQHFHGVDEDRVAEILRAAGKE